MLLTFQWLHEKDFDLFSSGPGLISISPCLSNNIKTKNEEKKKIIILRVLSYEHTPASFYEIQDRFA